MPNQVPTIPNFRLTHGSLKGFFEQQQADVICFQVRYFCFWILRPSLENGLVCQCQLSLTRCHCMQETKLQSEEKLTADIACVDCFEVC